MAASDFARLSGQSLSLYLHVPFCRDKCSYCDFYSVTGAAPALMEQVVDRLLADSRQAWQELGCPAVSTVYIGGGTPGFLPAALLERLLGGLNSWLDMPDDAQSWTLEVNPESLTEEKLEIARRNGVTRLSLGLQSFDDAILARLNRPVTARQNLAALELITREWTGEWNLDLMAGLPGQTWAGLQADLERAVGFGPGHVSFYSLTVEEDTPLAAQVARRQVMLPTEADQLWLAGADWLQAVGYGQYEISNFARPGRESKHNLHYWHLDPYLGVGPAAASTLPGPAGLPVRLQKPRSIETFLRQDLWGGEYETLSKTDWMKDQLMMEGRLQKGIRLAAWEQRFGTPLTELLPRTLVEFSGHWQVVDGFLRLDRPAWLQLDSFLLAAFDELDGRQTVC